jgi:lysine-ketoglutarate reductase/saccharopine dehydrogenase-like protein (TIGR00300 family)
VESPCRIYRPRNPRKTPLWGLLDTLYERVKGQWEERFERRYGFWRGLADGAVARYSTPNFDTLVRLDGTWQAVADQKMDCALVLRDGEPVCVKQGKVKKGEPVALRGAGIRVRPLERSRDYSVFGFMANDVTAEVNKAIAVAGTAREMKRVRDAGEKIVAVAGPAIVHSGGDVHLARLVREGWVDVILTGNAFAVHDLEKSILKTSLGVCQMSGRAVEGGSRHHLYAINAVNRAGSIKAAVETGVMTSGVMYEAVKKGIPCVLAGSIRDDGPLAAEF